MQAISYTPSFLSKVGRIMLAMHPNLVAREVRKTTPIITDFTLIPDIIGRIVCDDPYRRKLLSVAVVASLYSPVTLLDSKCQMPYGSLRYIMDATGIKSRKQSAALVSAARVYMKNKTFRDEVKSILTNITY